MTFISQCYLQSNKRKEIWTYRYTLICHTHNLKSKEFFLLGTFVRKRPKNVQAILNDFFYNMYSHTPFPEGQRERSLWKENKRGWRDHNCFLLIMGCHGEDGLNSCFQIKIGERDWRKLGTCYEESFSWWGPPKRGWAALSGSEFFIHVLVRWAIVEQLWASVRDAMAWLWILHQSDPQSLLGSS